MKQCEIIQFKNVLWIVDADSITDRSVKSEKQNFRRVPKFDGSLIPSFDIDIQNNDEVVISDVASQCDFLRFLQNTSIGIPCGLENKLTAIGYLLSSSKKFSDPNFLILNNDNNALGRNGKTILSIAISQLRLTMDIDGFPKYFRNPDCSLVVRKMINRIEIDGYPSILSFDDTHHSFNFEIIQQLIEKQDNIKVLVTTSCKIIKTLNNIEIVPFSGFYNETHKPIDDFGCRFFHEWNADQWNLFYNLMAHCIRLYLKHGVIKTI